MARIVAQKNRLVNLSGWQTTHLIYWDISWFSMPARPPPNFLRSYRSDKTPAGRFHTTTVIIYSLTLFILYQFNQNPLIAIVPCHRERFDQYWFRMKRIWYPSRNNLIRQNFADSTSIQRQSYSKHSVGDLVRFNDQTKSVFCGRAFHFVEMLIWIELIAIGLVWKWKWRRDIGIVLADIIGYERFAASATSYSN